MKINKIIYSCFLLLVTVLLSSCLVSERKIFADPSANKTTNRMLVEEPIFEAESKPVDFEYQLLTNPEKENKLLLYLKDSVNTMTVSTYDHMGRSKLMIKEQAMGKGFYNFSLPKATASNIQYWEVKLGSQRALVFKK